MRMLVDKKQTCKNSKMIHIQKAQAETIPRVTKEKNTTKMYSKPTLVNIVLQS